MATTDTEFTYDVSTSIGQVRMLCNDKYAEDFIFTDDEIRVFLTLNNDSTRLAAAMALDTIANDEAYVLKVITMLDLKTDGRATAEALRAGADRLRQQEAEFGEGAFALAVVPTPVFNGLL